MKKCILPIIAIILVLSLAPSPTQAQQVEITFVHIFGDENDIRGQTVAELVSEFEALTDVKVNLQTTLSDYEEVLTSTLLAAEQGNAPHVVQLDETATLFAVDSGQFISISSVATDEQTATFDDIIDPVYEFYVVDGELWSLPWNSSNPIMYYNRDMFIEVGLDPDNPPQTFDEVLAACEVIMNSDLDLSGCINWPLTSWFLETWVAMQGALLVDNENGRTGRATETYFTSTEMLLVFNWWKEMADRGFYSYTGKTVDYNGEAGGFITQRYAMHFNSTAGISNFQHYAGLIGYNVDAAPLPIPHAEATHGTINGGASLWLTQGHSDAETEAARDFIFFITSGENIARWHMATGYFPNRQSAIDIVAATSFWDENPAYQIAVEQLQNTTPSAATAGAVIGPHATVRGILETAVQSVIDQGESPEDALAAAKSLADFELEDYNLFYAD